MISREDRFWAKVEKTDSCWLWTGCLNAYGYGRLDWKIDGRRRLVFAHRYVLQMEGVDLGDFQVDHRCHVRHCVNPEHLRLVTHKQNRENLKGANSNSKTGIRGVTRNGHRWRGNVKCLGKRYSAYFDTLEEAVAWTIETRNRLFTHNDADRVA